jgi:hypothetical protein
MVQTKISITLSQACEGMLLNKQAEGRSIHTINDYRNSFQKLALFFSSDPPIDTARAFEAGQTMIVPAPPRKHLKTQRVPASHVHLSLMGS